MKKYDTVLAPRASQGIYTMLISVVLFYVSIAFYSCTNISQFSPEAYKQAVDLKVESLEVMSFATESYSDFETEVESLKQGLKRAYEYAKGRPDNEISTKQWEILMDEERNLLGGFLKRWKEEDTLSETFVVEAQMLISDAFDTIIGLESGKIDPSEIK